MESKKKIEVVINGQAHTFVTLEDDDYIKYMADYVDKKILEVVNSTGGKFLPNDKKLVLASMNIADDYFQTLTKYEELVKKSEVRKEPVSVVIAEDSGEIKKLQKENDELKDNIKNLEYELKYVQELIELQRKDMDS